ncbi:MAG: copper oxidase [Holophagales bacterium]|nr:copper oxidase [Holophagales bacterium]
MDRRSLLRFAGLAALGSALPLSAKEPNTASRPLGAPRRTTRSARSGVGSVVTPNGSTLPLRRSGRVLVGHLVAQVVDHEFAPGLKALVWGYNGGTPGPTIEATEGDRLRIYVTNRLPEPTTVHWHGLVLPNGMDGVSGLNQAPIPVGETWAYEFDLHRPGTFMYHSHYDEMTQVALGLVGMIVVHPRVPTGPPVDRDFVLMTHEWSLPVGARRPDPGAMSDFNLLTFNGKAYPGTAPLVVGTGERVRIRIGNLSPMDHHPIHLHGLSFEVTGTDGGDVPPSARWPETTVLVPTGSARVIELVPTEPGDWAVHCHMTHHVMTQMGHGLPNVVGADLASVDERLSRLVPGAMVMGTTGMGGMGEMAMPIPPNSLPMKGAHGPFGYVDMGGMFTVLKVRDDPGSADSEGWFRHPEGTVAGPADPARLAADGIEP